MQELRRSSWFRFRATIRRDLPGYVVLALLLASIGGLAMSAVAVARRTQSSYSALVAGTDPSDLTIIDSGLPTDARVLASIPHIAHISSARLLDIEIVGAKGARIGDGLQARGVYTMGGVDGLYFHQDRVLVTAGRLADPRRPDEVMLSADAARILGLHIGSVVPVAVFTQTQGQTPNANPAGVTPFRRAHLRVVGIAVFGDALVRDDIDRFPAFAVVTPAFARGLMSCCTNAVLSGIQLRHAGDLSSVEAAITREHASAQLVSVKAVVVGKAQRAIRPEVVALEVFGAIAGLAALVIGIQVIGRQAQARARDRSALRAVGAGPLMTATDGFIGTLIAIVAGAIGAATIALAASPLGPIGPVRTVLRSSGVQADWTVLGAGTAILIVVASTVAIAFGFRLAPHRVLRRGPGSRRGSRVALAAAASGAPLPMAIGAQFALDPGRGGSGVPVRSTMFGAALAVTVVAATLTFGASLSALVSRPALYGWNWNLEMVGAYGGISNVPEAGLHRLLDHDPSVAAWSGGYLVLADIDGHSVPTLAATPGAAVAPPPLSGTSLDRPDQVVLGAGTLAMLHKRVGDTVTVRGVAPKPVSLTIAGTSTMPAIGVFGSFHLEMGSGALLASSLLPTAARGFGDHDGPEAVFVRLHAGTNQATALRSLERVAARLNTPGDGLASVVSVQRPAEIVNYRTQQSTPLYLGLGLAAGATAALALTLLASVRRRRRDLAILKTLGFGRRQLAAAVAWQSTVVVVIGSVIGVPAGVAIGRLLWSRFAAGIHVVPQPVAPVLGLALVALGGLVLANLVALIPGRQAARTSTAPLLRAE